jgi:hypothetical protein
MGTVPLDGKFTTTRNKINALPVRNHGPVAFSSIIAIAATALHPSIA